MQQVGAESIEAYLGAGGGISPGAATLGGGHVVDWDSACLATQSNPIVRLDQQIEGIDRFAVFRHEVIASLEHGVAQERHAGADQAWHWRAKSRGVKR